MSLNPSCPLNYPCLLQEMALIMRQKDEEGKCFRGYAAHPSLRLENSVGVSGERQVDASSRLVTVVVMVVEVAMATGFSGTV